MRGNDIQKFIFAVFNNSNNQTHITSILEQAKFEPIEFLIMTKLIRFDQLINCVEEVW